MSEKAILTVYWFAHPHHYKWLMKKKKWTVTIMLFFGMKY